MRSRETIHVLAFATRESCMMLECWLRWASSWLVTDDQPGLGAAYDYSIHLVRHTPNVSRASSGLMRTDRWYAVLRDRLLFVRDQVHALPINSKILFMDLDVVPLRPPANLLRPLPPHDITFMREPPGHGGRTGRHIVNAGLYLVVVSLASRRFLGHWAWLTHQQRKLHDQDTANWILLAKSGQSMHHADLRWGTWPHTTAAGRLEDVTNETIAFHAIFATGEEKLGKIAGAIERHRQLLGAAGDGQQSATASRLAPCTAPVANGACARWQTGASTGG